MLGFLFLIDRVLPRNRVVLLELDLALNGLLVLGRIIRVAFAHALGISDGDELDEVLL